MNQKEHARFLEQAAARIDRFTHHPEFHRRIEDFKRRYLDGLMAYNRAKYKAFGDSSLRATAGEMNQLQEGTKPERTGYELEKYDFVRIEGVHHCWWHEPLQNPMDCVLPDWFHDRHMGIPNDQTEKRSPVDQDEYLDCCAFLLAVIADRWGHGIHLFAGDPLKHWKRRRNEIEEFYGLVTPYQQYDPLRESYCGVSVREKIAQAVEAITQSLTARAIAA